MPDQILTLISMIYLTLVYQTTALLCFHFLFTVCHLHAAIKHVPLQYDA